MLTQSSNLSLIDHVKLVAFVRERDRILLLTELLLEKENLVQEDISAELYSQVEQ